MKYFATTAVENSAGEFLVVHHAGKERPWRFPGGKLDTRKGESAIDCSIRELREEVGIIPTAPRPRFLGIQHVTIDGDDWVGYGFHITEWTGTPRILEPAKHDQLLWITPAKLEELGSTLCASRSVRSFELNLVTLSRLTPIQERIMSLIVQFEKEKGVTNEQLAARAGITNSAWRNELDTVRKAARLQSRKAHRSDLVAWWRRMRGGL